MFQRLKQEIGVPPSSQGTSSPSSSTAWPNSSSPAQASPSGSPSTLPAPTAPAAPLQPFSFPDGTGAIGLPVGWKVVFAQKTDVLAKGPKGEVLRFGLNVPIVDPRDSRASALGPIRNGTGPGSFLAIPYGIDAATAFKAFTAQLAIKNRNQPSAMNIGNVQQIPASGGGRIFLISGDVDTHDGQGPLTFVAKVVMSAQASLGTWSMTIYQVNVPKPLYAEEANTIARIFPSYSVNVQVAVGIIKSEMDQVNRITNDFIDWTHKSMDNSNRMTAGFCDFLREQTVIKDTDNGTLHVRTSDSAAQLLINSGRFEAVPTSQYIKGIDY